MLFLTRQEIEILLDAPEETECVVSAYADMTVQDGFSRHVELHLRNEARAAGSALAATTVRKDLDANIKVVREAIAEAPPSARGLAVFSCVARRLRHVVPLEFPVENRLVIDEDVFVLPLLERWHSDAAYLIVLADSAEAHFFEARHGHLEPVRDVHRDDLHQQIQRDKPRFTYKKRFAKTEHERLHGIEDSRFFHQIAQAAGEHARSGHFTGLVLLGHSYITQLLGRLLPRELAGSVVGEAPHPMTGRPEDLNAEVSRLIECDREAREARILSEYLARHEQRHLVASGPTEVLDALQQGRATEILFGGRHDLPGSRCYECGYLLGASVATCPYCQGKCRTISAAQEIYRMALRHRVPVQVFRNGGSKASPLASAGGVAAFVRAEANWARNGQTVGVAETT